MKQTGGYSIDTRLIERAEREESAIILKGETDGGMPVMVIVVTGANVGILREKITDILPGVLEFP